MGRRDNGTGRKRNSYASNGHHKHTNNNNHHHHHHHGKANGFEPVRNGKLHTSSRTAKQNGQQSLAWTHYVSMVVGFMLALYLGYRNACYIDALHENRLWFSNIKEVEREISFRTEAGFYYSFYKQIVFAPSIVEGLYALTHDNDTENWRTINALERFNIYQEVVLGIIYRTFGFIQRAYPPIFFYIYSVFSLHGLYLVALYCTAWMLTRSWLAGVLASAFYVFNKDDTTRVDYTIPLRESFALPMLFLQMACITYYLRPITTVMRQRLCVAVTLLSSFLFVLTWQFAQFVFLLQAMALYGSASLQMVPRHKVVRLLLLQAVCILSVCILQFFNKMLLGSLVFSFIMAALLDLRLQGSRPYSGGILTSFAKLLVHIALVLILTVLINMTMKFAIGLEADQHIYKFLTAKFGIANTRDFDALMYQCNGAFGFLPVDTFWRLSRRLVFPLYMAVMVGLLIALATAVYQNWRNQADLARAKKDDDTPPSQEALDSIHLLSDRPELAYLAIQSVFSACLALAIQRLKYLWLPHVCVLAAFGVSDYQTWRALLTRLGFKSESGVQSARHVATFLVLALVLSISLPRVYTELEELREFYDPDTVELMNWIREQTPKATVYSGSMQLLAGVKLCTGRRLTNHPHYEDKELRERTLQLYQYYGRRMPKEVYNIHKAMGTDYIILEDSICYARAAALGCRLPDLIDISNGHLYNGAQAEELKFLAEAKVGRFCDVIKQQTAEYTRYFYLAFHNKTFRVYKVL
ncbi:probable C-mannosyltransferase DPY19L3 isoform X2 [Acanthaster planci]|uniref:Probable C-mannosyltransferase DPY19L3 isoform X2 n=1 Tax=Acanthaster planci TaxID=133434 RepID=A0A8B7XPD8_ACAPL|nr:probable C-mannosyltransferase DPY19L3 isoform X2 [Acanthaster planci]XP_022081921.1 probable C-mannosyltransferase DPY19L3 isoform X2 [Acanthaster planci]XP_022081922.1 probable C-mannosyltransferase DPY19L3 isoform X2 [Acanthaster planci]